jgi:hypothetical protein
MYLTVPPSRASDNQEQGWDGKRRSLAHMQCRRLLNYRCLLPALLVFACSAVSVGATAVPISGSYEVVQKTGSSAQNRVTVRFHLINHGTTVFHLRRLVLSDFSHPPAGVPLTPPLALPPGATEETTQDFTLPSLQLSQWQKGVLPRAVLELETAAGGRATLAIRLERTPVLEGK